MVTGVQRLMLDRPECDALAKACAEVASHYDLPAVAPETLAWINLIQTAGVIYGSRIIAARMEAQAHRAARAQPTQSATPVYERPADAPAPPSPQYPTGGNAQTERHQFGDLEIEVTPLAARPTEPRPMQ